MTSSELESPLRPTAPKEPFIPAWIRLLVRIWMYGRGPVVLYRRPAISMLPSFVAMTGRDESALPTSLREYLLNTERRLAAIGFGPPVRARNHLFANIHSCVSLLEHPTDGTIGHVHLIGTLRLDRLRVSVTFQSEFDDAKIVNTSNSGTNPRQPSRPEVLGLRITEVEDPVELYEIHRFRVAERTRYARQVPMTRGTDPFAYQHAESMAVFEHWLRRKYYRRDGAHGLRFTVRGAALSAWRGMFPWREISEWARSRRAAELLERYRRTRDHAS